MVDEGEQPAPSTLLKKRKKMPKKHRDSKKWKAASEIGKKVRISQKMQKLYRKRARDYNSDDDQDEAEDELAPESDGDEIEVDRDDFTGNSDDETGLGNEEDLDEEREIQTRIIKFAEGCKAFRVAFQNIMKKHVDDESLVICTSFCSSSLR